MIRPLTIFLVALLAAPALAQPGATPDELAARFARANETFEAAVAQLGRDETAAAEGLRRAASLYASIVDQQGVESSDLLTNAANARLLAGDLGRAIALYHRALRLDPSDPRARSNLDVARERAAAGAAIEPARSTLDSLTAWRHALGVDARLAIALTAWAAVWLAPALWRLGVRRWPARAFAAAWAVVFAIAFVTLVADDAAQNAPPVGVVTASETTGRTGPDAVAYDPAFTRPLPEGVEFRVLQSRSGWVQARLADGRTCWLPEGDVAIVRS